MAATSRLDILIRAKDNASATLKRVNEQSSKMASSFAAARVPLMILGGAASAAVVRFGTLGDEIQKMSLRTGFSTESLSELRFAMEQSGTSIQGFEVGVRRMTGFIEDAKDGLATSTDAMDKLGVSVEDLVGKKPEEAFFILANSMASVEDEVQKAALAQDVFGRSGTQLLPLLAEGAEGVARLRQEARDLGIVFDEETANKAAEMQDSINRAKQSMNAMSIEIGTALSPAISGLATGFARLPSIIQSLTLVAGVFFTAMSVGLISVRSALISTGIGAILVGIGIAIDQLDKNWNAFVERFGGITNHLIGMMEQYVNNHIKGFNLIAGGLEKLTNLLPGVNVEFTKLSEVTLTRVTKRAEEAAEALDDIVEEDKTWIRYANAIDQNVVATDALTGSVGGLGQAMVDAHNDSVAFTDRVLNGNIIIRTSTEDTVVNLTSKWGAYHEKLAAQAEEKAARETSIIKMLGDLEIAEAKRVAEAKIVQEQRVQGIFNTLRGRFNLDQQEALQRRLAGSLTRDEAFQNLQGLLDLRARTALSTDTRALGDFSVGAAGGLLGVGANTSGSGLDLISQIGAIPESFRAIIEGLARATGQQVQISMAPGAGDMIVAEVVNSQLNGAEL